MITNQFDPHQYIKTVTIVGLGGTGAQTARIAGRILYDMKRLRMHTPRLVLIDPDCVEEKNVGRQLFSAGDIGKYKVEVVGKRLNLGLGLDVRWMPELVDTSRHFDGYGGVIISCVDNHLARAEISKTKGILIGAGNSRDSGQVCIGNTDDHDLVLKNLDPADGKFRYLPTESLLFPQLLEPEVEEPTPLLSCADLTMSGDQSLLVNDWMAAVIGQYLYKLLHHQPITTFLSYLSLETLSIRSIDISKSELLARLTDA